MDSLNDQANPTNLELLRIARDLAYSDYNNRKADIHNKWVSESAQLWQTRRQRLAYPPIPTYPTEEEIVERALKLVSFLSTHRPDLEYQDTSDMPFPTEDAPNQYIATYSEAPIAEESSEKMLSSMMKKFENLFNKGDKK